MTPDRCESAASTTDEEGTYIMTGKTTVLENFDNYARTLLSPGESLSLKEMDLKFESGNGKMGIIPFSELTGSVQPFPDQVEKNILAISYAYTGPQKVVLSFKRPWKAVYFYHFTVNLPGVISVSFYDGNGDKLKEFTLNKSLPSPVQVGFMSTSANIKRIDIHVPDDKDFFLIDNVTLLE